MTSENSPLGVLITNLGTPDAPTTEALRRYLKEFLSDRRIIEVPRFIWWFILNGYILQTRPQRLAELYKKIWMPDGSPLLVFTRRLAGKFAVEFKKISDHKTHVVVGMRYGNPSLAEALDELKKRDCRRLLVLPLYPQYSAATTASTFDAVARELKGWRSLPELRMVMGYHDEPEYIGVLVESILDSWRDAEMPRKLIFSFHGLPQKNFRQGDPYFYACHATAKLAAEALHLDSDAWQVSFQSRFGEEEWLKPYTAVTLGELAQKGIKNVDVVCPGFAVDCLETLEEIAVENRRVFIACGGEVLRYIPALNATDAHARALAHIAARYVQAWMPTIC